MSPSSWMNVLSPGFITSNVMNIHGVSAMFVIMVIILLYTMIIGLLLSVGIRYLLLLIFGRETMREFVSRKPFVEISKQMQLAAGRDWLSSVLYMIVFTVVVLHKFEESAHIQRIILLITTLSFTVLSAYRHEYILMTDVGFIKLRSLNMIPFVIFLSLISGVVFVVIFPAQGAAPHFLGKWTDSLVVFFPSVWGLVIKSVYEYIASKLSKGYGDSLLN